jgi:hypothetical protein
MIAVLCWQLNNLLLSQTYHKERNSEYTSGEMVVCLMRTSWFSGGVSLLLLVIAALLLLAGIDNIGGIPVIAAGSFPIGYLAAGDFAMGVFAAGTFSVGIFAAGIFSIGIFSIGIFSIGIFSVGLYALGIYVIRNYLTSPERKENQNKA